MRTSLRTLAIAAAIAVPAVPALAAKPTTRPTAHPPVKTKPVCKPVPAAGVAYVVRGVLLEDATATGALIKVTGKNAHARKAMVGVDLTGGLSVGIAACTKITKVTVVGKLRTQGWANLKKGDRILVVWKAKAGKKIADLGAARRIVELKG